LDRFSSGKEAILLNWIRTVKNKSPIRLLG
jgi:hypothetical protein